MRRPLVRANPAPARSWGAAWPSELAEKLTAVQNLAVQGGDLFYLHRLVLSLLGAVLSRLELTERSPLWLHLLRDRLSLLAPLLDRPGCLEVGAAWALVKEQLDEEARDVARYGYVSRALPLLGSYELWSLLEAGPKVLGQESWRLQSALGTLLEHAQECLLVPGLGRPEQEGGLGQKLPEPTEEEAEKIAELLLEALTRAEGGVVGRFLQADLAHSLYLKASFTSWCSKENFPGLIAEGNAAARESMKLAEKLLRGVEQASGQGLYSLFLCYFKGHGVHEFGEYLLAVALAAPEGQTATLAAWEDPSSPLFYVALKVPHTNVPKLRAAAPSVRASERRREAAIARAEWLWAHASLEVDEAPLLAAVAFEQGLTREETMAIAYELSREYSFAMEDVVRVYDQTERRGDGQEWAKGLLGEHFAPPKRVPRRA